MSDQQQTEPIPEQIIPTFQAEQPKKHWLSGRSRKPLPLKMQVISRYSLGVSKSKIAKALEIEVNTVSRIIKESKIESAELAGANFGVKSLVLDSVEGIAHHVAKKSLRASMYVLDNTIFKENAGRTMNAAVQINLNIPRPAEIASKQPAIELESTASEVHQSPEVIDNKQVD